MVEERGRSMCSHISVNWFGFVFVLTFFVFSAIRSRVCRYVDHTEDGDGNGDDEDRGYPLRMAIKSLTNRSALQAHTETHGQRTEDADRKGNEFRIKYYLFNI